MGCAWYMKDGVYCIHFVGVLLEKAKNTIQRKSMAQSTYDDYNRPALIAPTDLQTLL